MKFTYEDLAKAMGLKVGDRIKWSGQIYTLNSDFYVFNEKNKSIEVRLSRLIDYDFEILPPKKKVGELRCNDFTCGTCPFNLINCDGRKSTRETLYDILKRYNVHYKDQEIYDIMKKRLDKEVEE